jgi:DNA-binding NarL/FixJ family response regulator
MADVIALIPDLLFGSRVQAMLLAQGADVEMVGSTDVLEGSLADARVLIVDLTDESFGGVELMESLSARGVLKGIRTLAFYSHVDIAVRERAVQAGFDLIVPRSRMAREGDSLVAGLLGRG